MTRLFRNLALIAGAVRELWVSWRAMRRHYPETNRDRHLRQQRRKNQR